MQWELQSEAVITILYTKFITWKCKAGTKVLQNQIWIEANNLDAQPDCFKGAHTLINALGGEAKYSCQLQGGGYEA